MEKQFYSHCIYTSVTRARLEDIVRDNRKGTFSKTKRWVTGAKLLKEAQDNGLEMPVLFADAEDPVRLSHWAVLTGIVLRKGETSYSFRDLRSIREGHTPEELLLRSSGKPMASGYNDYSLCQTPDFLTEESQEAVGEPEAVEEPPELEPEPEAVEEAPEPEPEPEPEAVEEAPEPEPEPEAVEEAPEPEPEPEPEAVEEPPEPEPEPEAVEEPPEPEPEPEAVEEPPEPQPEAIEEAPEPEAVEEAPEPEPEAVEEPPEPEPKPEPAVAEKPPAPKPKPAPYPPPRPPEPEGLLSRLTRKLKSWLTGG